MNVLQQQLNSLKKKKNLKVGDYASATVARSSTVSLWIFISFTIFV